MLTGTTFAWFTDQETSGNNHIIAGNLDVKLLHTNDVDVDEEVDGTTKLFDSITLWEPGAVVWENLTVENAGNLSLKYLLNVVMSNQVPDGTVKLSDVLYVEFVTDANGDPAAFSGNRADAIALFDNDSKKLTDFVNDYAATGELLPKADGATENPSETHGIVIYWKPSDNDNLYNMNNGKNTELSLEIGVILNATQLDNEEDAFGKDYDEGLEPLPSGVILETFADGSKFFRANNGITLYDVPENFNDTSYTVPADVTALGARIFNENSNITTVTLNDGLKSIGNRTFRNCSSLTSITLPATLTEIGPGAFQSSGLTSVVIPDNVTVIGENAFYGCLNLTSVNIPEGVEAIEKNAFRGLKVTEITIPSTVTTIGEFAFRDNYSMEKVTILSENITSIGNGAFLKASGTFPAVTIYVKNDAVKNVVAAATSGYSFVTIEIMP